MKRILKKQIDLNGIILIMLLLGLLFTPAIAKERIAIGVSAIIVIAFCIYNLRYKKIPLFLNWIDIVMLILALSPIIPLIFGTYVSFSYTIKYIIKYFCIFGIYITTRNICINNDKNISKILNIFIGIIIILIMIGLDRITFNILEPIMQKIGNLIPYNDGLLVSTFGYKNAFAAIIAFGIMIVINKYIIKETMTLKCIYATIVFFFITSIFLTESRTIILILGLVGVIYLLLLKNKKYFIDILIMLFMNLCFSLLYVYTFKKYINLDMYYSAYISLIISFGSIYFIHFVLYRFCKRFYENLYKIDFVKIILIFVIILIFMIIALVLILKSTITGIQLFNNNSTGYYKTIKNIPKEEDYIIEFDIESEVTTSLFLKNKDTYKIIISERDIYEDSIIDHEITWNDFSGIKKIKFEKDPKTVILRLKIECNNIHSSKQLNVNYMKINEKEVILAYKFFPISVVERFTDLSLDNKSVWERMVFIQDAFELIKKNPILGYGGNSWDYLYKEVQNYYYVTTETHSYITELWIDFGITGVLSYVVLNVMIVFYYLKQREERDSNTTLLTSLLCCVSIITLHSIMDFDMSMLMIIFVVYMMFGMINSKLITNKAFKKRNYLFYIILIIVMGSLTTISFNQQIYSPLKRYEQNNELINTKGSSIELITNKISILEDIMEKEKKYNTISIYYDYAVTLLNHYEKIDTQEENMEKIERIVDKICAHENPSPYYTYSYIEMYNKMNLLCDKLELRNAISKNDKAVELIKRLRQTIIEKYEKSIQNINSYECKSTKEEKKQALQIINKVYEQVIENMDEWEKKE